MAENEQGATEQPKEKDIDINALIETLEKANVTDPKILEGKFEASRQAGHLANQLGDTRSQLESTRSELAELKRMMQESQKRPANRAIDDLDSYGEGQPINIQEEITKGVKKVFSEMQQQQTLAQQKAYSRATQIANAIKNDRYYPAVKEIWDAKCQDPTFIMEVNTGRTDPLTAYKELIIEFQGNLLSQSAGALKNYKGVQTPNVESSGSRGQRQGNLVSESPEGLPPDRQKQINLLTKVNKGYRATDEEILDTFDSVINEAFRK